MEIIKRELNELERRIVDLQYLYAIKKVKKPFNWKTGGIKLFIILVFIILNLFFGIDWFSIIIIVVMIISIYIQIKSFFDDRKMAIEKRETAKESSKIILIKAPSNAP